MSKRNKREKVKAKHNELFFFYPFPTNLRGDKMMDLDESMEGKSLYFHSLPLLLLNQTKDCLSFPSHPNSQMKYQKYFFNSYIYFSPFQKSNYKVLKLYNKERLLEM